jgi:hypothetical protein
MASIPTIKELRYPTLQRRTDIRIVKLHHGAFEDPIRCSLTATEFSNLLTYEAVSYEWGIGPYDATPIYINGTPYRVRESLYEALYLLRRTHEDRLIWIDCFCIDQRYHIEKNHQLQLMANIYSRADNVIVWLGSKLDPAGNDGEVAVQFLKWIHDVDAERAQRILNQNTAAHEKNIRAVVAICNRSYWNRIWIIEEILKAKQATLHCGSTDITWEHFTRACRFIYNFAGYYPVSLPDKSVPSATNSQVIALATGIRQTLAIHLSEYIYRQNRTNRLIDWLFDTQKSKSSKAKDRVYALRGLAQDWPDWFEIDYGESKKTQDVYEDVKRMYCMMDASQWSAWDVIVRKALGLEVPVALEADKIQSVVLEKEVDGNEDLDGMVGRPRVASFSSTLQAPDMDYFDYNFRVLRSNNSW